ncbi:hypothetical protein A3H09_03010 [Candidatus Falkowbacteria bacterium RIFCSPLOWO2_12_FULL_45_13]|uniref:GIY-YIG domain-containing protein n=2 Tax=Candidatus Falkowiibacteriota TaxID=1752728 RepID=A0A1F5SAI3_9BACT|nr:MAG: hypothetical protein A3H66_00180 [Candidatus Falkowbacteria bacterium RIFCSPLOWO2_02_FULL_45_21]OGF30484.1 MAG: hypothetical protein A3H09_03010 [Candidatus Falkowbacteria bacterium RIFCSPLOWO2_12_FULL_45_13]
MVYEKYYYAYINTNKSHNVFYAGVTNNLLNRNKEHQDKESRNSFTVKYNEMVTKLFRSEI